MSSSTEEKKTSSSEVKPPFDAKNPDLGLLEEDDEFEEFPAEEWSKESEDATDANVWEDNWDDDTVEDDFSVQLKKYSRKRSHSATRRSPPLRSPEPVAKKVCSRSTPTSAAANGRNGASADMDTSEPPADNGNNGQSPSTPRRNSRRSSSRSSRGGAAAEAESNGSNGAAAASPARTTRSSARLRSSRK